MNGTGEVRAAAFFPGSRGSEGSVDIAWSADGRQPPEPRRGGHLAVVREGPFSRLLGVRTADGVPFLLEVQRDIPAEKEFGGLQGVPLNGIVDDHWAAVLAGGGTAPGLPAAAAALGPARYHPLLFCNEKGVAFHVPCPGCRGLGTMEECRDDVALATVGRPRHAEGNARYLWCPRCSSGARKPRLFSAAPNLSGDEAGLVESRDALVRSMGEVVRAAAGGGLPEETRRGFPCAGCDQAATCYPSGDGRRPAEGGAAVARIDPVAVLPFHAVPRPEAPLGFAEHLDIKSGATWAGFRVQHGRSWSLRAHRSRREALESSLFPRIRSMAPVRALAARLALFEAVVSAVAALQKRTGRPHLALAPGVLHSGTTSLDAAGPHAVDILDSLGSVPLSLRTGDPAGPAFHLPPPGLRAPYAHPDLLGAAARAPGPGDGPPYGRPVAVAVEPGRVWTPEGPGAAEFEVDLRGEGLRAGDLHPGDRIALTIDGRGWEEVLLWCRVDPETGAGAGAAPYRAGPARLLPTQLMDIRGARREQPLRGTATVWRSYGAFYDTWSLGVLLLQALLANAENPFDQVSSLVIPPLVAAGTRAAAGGGAPWEDCLGRVDRLLETPALRDFLAPHNVCFLPSEHRSGAAAVPRRLWLDLLGTAVACLTCEPGLSFASGDRLEEDAAAVAKPVERLLLTLRRIRSEIPAGADPETARFPAAPAGGGGMGTAPPAPAAAGFVFADAGGAAPAAPSGRAGAPSFEAATASPLPAATPEMEAENRRLAESLREKSARLERLEAEVETLRRKTSQDDMVTRPFSPPVELQSAEGWKDLMDQFLDTTAHPFRIPVTGGPDHEMARAVLTDGLEALNSLRAALAELGGADFAEEQGNLRRLVRRALVPGRDRPPDPALVEEFRTLLRESPKSVGRAIAVLTEAHSRSVQVGTRQLLLTMEVAIRNELGMKGAQERDLHALIQRMVEKAPELAGRLYDRTFQEFIREQLKGVS